MNAFRVWEEPTSQTQAKRHRSNCQIGILNLPAGARQLELESLRFDEIVKIKADQDAGIDVKGKYGMFPWEVEQQYRKWLTLEQGGASITDQIKLREFWLDWLPPQEVETHLASGGAKSGAPFVFTTPDGQKIKYNTQELQASRNKYRTRQEETATAAAEQVRGPAAGAFASERFDSVMNRYLSAFPEMALYKPDPATGEITRDLTVLPPDLRTQIERLTGIETVLQSKYERLDQMATIQLDPASTPDRIKNLESERSSMARETNALEHARAGLYAEMEKTVVAEATAGFTNDSAKAAIGDYMLKGHMDGLSKDTSAFIFEAFTNVVIFKV